MSNNTNDSSLCEIAQQLSVSTALRSIDSLKICLAIVGIIMFTTLLYRKVVDRHLTFFRLYFQGTYIGFHRNARILLLIHHFCVFAYLLTDIGQTTFQLIWFAIDRANPCDYLITMLIATIVRTPNVYFMYVNVYSNFVIVIERVLAFVYYTSYEVTPFVGCRTVLIAFEFLITTIIIGLALRLLDWSDLKTSARIASGANSQYVTYIQFGQIGVEILSVIICYILLYLNRRKKRQLLSASISEKYQIDENIRVMLLMLPIVWCHLICYTIPLAVSGIYLLYDSNTNTVAFELLTDGSDMVLIYPILLSIVLFILYNRDNIRRLRTIGILQSTNRHNPQIITEQSAHFAALRSSWENDAQQHRSLSIILQLKMLKYVGKSQSNSRQNVSVNNFVHTNSPAVTNLPNEQQNNRLPPIDTEQRV